MSTTAKLEKSVRSYLTHKSIEGSALKCTFDTLCQKLPDTVIFGGMLREFGLGYEKDFTSDIDLVSAGSRQEIHAAIADFSPTMNNFGGFRFSRSGRSFDIWSLEDTWAFRKHHVIGHNFNDLLNTTFFKIDSVAFHICRNELIYSDNFVDAMDNRVLDTNLEANPNPQKMAHKAIKMAYDKNLTFTLRLGTYVLENADRDQLDSTSIKFLNCLENHSFKNFGNFKFDPQLSLI